MKRIFALALSLVVVIFALPPATVYAANPGNCDHNYETDTFTSDICTKCGQIRPDIDAPYELSFIVREETAVARKEPRQTSEVVKQYNWGTKIQVVARIRNEYNNMWLRLSDGSYMFSDRAAFDFDSMVSYAQVMVGQSSGSPMCYTTFSFRHGLDAHCSYPLFGKLASMYIHFRPGGTFDLKGRNKLGSGTYDYYVYANGAMLDKRYTGEALGNILYGYTCRDMGISLNDSIKFAGLAESREPTDTAACLFLNELPRCDDQDDIDMVTLGWNHFYQSNGGFSSGSGFGGGGGGGSGW